MRSMVEGYAQVFVTPPARTVRNIRTYPSTTFGGPPPPRGRKRSLLSRQRAFADKFIDHLRGEIVVELLRRVLAEVG